LLAELKQRKSPAQSAAAAAPQGVLP